MTTLAAARPARAIPLRSRTALVLAASAALGAFLSMVWSARFVDQTIGEDLASRILGYDAVATPIAGALAGAVFAFVSGLTGTFTACNIAAFGAVGPLARSRMTALRSAGWLALGATAIAGLYGAIAALLGPNVPQLSPATVGSFPVRLLQSSVIFGALGVTFIALGLAAARVIRDPLRALADRWPPVRLVVAGGLIGAFLIGRPFPLFLQLLRYAAETHEPLFGAAAFALQSAGNIALLTFAFVAASRLARGRGVAWLDDRADRVSHLNVAALVTAGTFLVTYWCLRVPSFFGIGWWPKAPWT